MKHPDELPINFNEGLDEFPTVGLVEEYDPPPNPSNPATDIPPADDWRAQHIREYQAQIQAELAIENSKRAEQARHERENVRAYRQRGYAPGYRHEQITLIDRDWKRDFLGHPYSDGWWLARCQCGATVRVQTRWIRVNLRKSRACAACLEKMPPRSFTRNDAGRPHKRLEGVVAGRLTVNLWYPGIGWLCTCATCGGQETCRNSAEVWRRGTRGCDGTCVQTEK